MWNLTCNKIVYCSEKTLKITFLSRIPFIVKLEFEIWKYLPSFSPCSNIWSSVLMLVFNSSPRFYSHPACRLLELQLIFCKFSCCRRMCSTHTQKSQNLIKHRGLLRWRFSLSLHLVRLSENLHLGLSFWFQLTWPAVSLEECQERIENVCGHLLAIYKIGCQDTQTFTGKRNIHK